MQVQLDKSSASGPPTYSSGEEPTFNVMLNNSGPGNCRLDVSGKGVVVTVTPVGSSQAVWTSAACASGGQDLRVLGPGDDSTTVPVKWDRENAVGSCPTAPQLVSPGAYTASAAVSGVTGASVQFTLQ